MSQGFSVQQLCQWVEGEVVNEAPHSDLLVKRLNSVLESKEGEVAFFFSPKLKDHLAKGAPSVLVTGKDFVEPLRASGLPVWKTAVVIACPNPYWALARVSGEFAALQSTVAHLPQSELGEPEVHPSAVVHENVELGRGVKVGAHCVIEEGCRLGEGVNLYPGCILGPGCQVGAHTVLFARVVLYERVSIGEHTRIHAGCVLGADGFGFAPKMTPDGQVERHQKIYHLGHVRVGNHVEIGANSCVDRGTMEDTIIEDGVIIDDHVMIGHNARLRRGAIVCGNAGLAGSCDVGEFAVIAGMAGVGNKVKVGAGAQVGAQTQCAKDVSPGVGVMGNPFREARAHWKIQAKLDKMIGYKRNKQR